VGTLKSPLKSLLLSKWKNKIFMILTFDQLKSFLIEKGESRAEKGKDEISTTF